MTTKDEKDWRFARPSMSTVKKTAVRRRKAASSGRKGGEFADLPSDGTSRWRILGPWSEKALKNNHFYAVRFKHFKLAEYGEGGRTFARCLRARDGSGECPICEVLDEHRDEDGDNKLWKQEATPEFIFNAIRRAKPNEQHVLSALGRRGQDMAQFLEDEVERALDEDDFYILDLRKGCDIVVKVDKAGKKTKTSFSLHASPRGPTPALKGTKPEDIEFADLYVFERVSDEDRQNARQAARALRKMLRARDSARRDDDLDDDGAEDVPDAEEEKPHGWRESTKRPGKPRAPRILKRTGKQECFGNWFDELRGNDEDEDTATNPQCRICPAEAECREESED